MAETPTDGLCKHSDPVNGYRCTLEAGHSGHHAANYPSANPTVCFARWDDNGYVPADESPSLPPGGPQHG